MSHNRKFGRPRRLNDCAGKTDSCEFNIGIICPQTLCRDCCSCGWNPKESKRRCEQIKNEGFSVNRRGKSFINVGGKVSK